MSDPTGNALRARLTTRPALCVSEASLLNAARAMQARGAAGSELNLAIAILIALAGGSAEPDVAPAFSAGDLAACARREVGQRRRVYPRLIGRQTMTREEAARETAMMEAIAADYAARAEADPAGSGRLV